MHTTELGTANVPAFLTKLWKLVKDPVYNDLISWSQNGRSFIIKNQSRFSKELLPLYFKHNNMASFIRQLNMYGFRKLTNIENSGLKTDKDEMEFYHQCFIKEQEGLLEFIKRKVSNVKSPSEATSGQRLEREDVSDMLSDMKTIRDRQESTDSTLVTMQRENEALWREIAVLRQKHQKQQHIVDKLIHFLVSLVSNRNGFLKRKVPLMIEGLADEEAEGAKRPRVSSTGGPVIHDVTDDILEADLEETANSSPIITSATAGETIDSPVGQIFDESSNQASNYSPLVPEVSPLNFTSVQSETLGILDPLENLVAENCLVDVNLDSLTSLVRATTIPTSCGTAAPSSDPGASEPSEDQVTQAKLLVNPATTSKLEMVPSSIANVTNGPLTNFSKDYFNEQLDGIETEINWLQDQLSTGGLNIDSSALLGVGPEAILQLFVDNQLGNFLPSSSRDANNVVGNELTRYHPSNETDLPDLDFSAMVNDESTGKDSVDNFDLDVDSLLTGGTCNGTSDSVKNQQH